MTTSFIKRRHPIHHVNLVPDPKHKSNANILISQIIEETDDELMADATTRTSVDYLNAVGVNTDPIQK